MSSWPPPLSPPGQMAAPRLLPSSMRRRRPPWRAPRQPSSPSARLGQRAAAGLAATLGAVMIFTSAAVQLSRSPTAIITALWPTWRRGLAAGMVLALNGATSGQSLRVQPPLLFPKVPTMLLHSSPCLSRQQESQTADRSVEQLIGELIAATACLFAQGLGECWARGKMNGQMSADTKEQGSVLIAGLLVLRNGTAGKLDFNAVARLHGARVLKDRYGQGVSDKT